MATALVVGGTAATGVSIVAGLRERGYDVTIYHRGTHELPELDALEHIHGDPHHRDTIAADLGTRRWDVVVATYGRIRNLDETLQDRTAHIVSVPGWPARAPPIRPPPTDTTPT